mmetsp:Transcript_64774/g.159433  ORF Transcript_64774/g.159433 Transcript_64774/m.159433 type:complete len:273 (+) Transcript_64774:361-1179(+)
MRPPVVPPPHPRARVRGDVAAGASLDRAPRHPWTVDIRTRTVVDELPIQRLRRIVPRILAITPLLRIDRRAGGLEESWRNPNAAVPVRPREALVVDPEGVAPDPARPLHGAPVSLLPVELGAVADNNALAPTRDLREHLERHLALAPMLRIDSRVVRLEQALSKRLGRLILAPIPRAPAIPPLEEVRTRVAAVVPAPLVIGVDSAPRAPGRIDIRAPVVHNRLPPERHGRELEREDATAAHLGLCGRPQEVLERAACALLSADVLNRSAEPL